MNKMKKLKVYYFVTGILLLMVAIGALYAGVGLILKPDGSYLGMNVNLLRNSPFESFLIPGIALLIVNGLGSILGSLLSLKRSPLTGHVTLILGVCMIIWIFAQLYWIGFQSILQVVFIVVGILEIMLGWIIFNNRKQNLES
jgi:hypothetical protein